MAKSKGTRTLKKFEIGGSMSPPDVSEEIMTDIMGGCADLSEPGRSKCIAQHYRTVKQKALQKRKGSGKPTRIERLEP